MKRVQYFYRDSKGMKHNTYVKTTCTLDEIKVLAHTDVSHLPFSVQDCVHTYEKYGASV